MVIPFIDASYAFCCIFVILEKSNGFNDSNAYTEMLGFEKCYDHCVFNLSCLAVMWSNRVCTFISDKNNPIDCPLNAICTTMFGKRLFIYKGDSTYY